MSLFPAYFGGRKHANEDAAPTPPDENESRADVFNLIPPSAAEKYERSVKTAETDKAETPSKAEGRNVHAVSAMDLSRLSIDDDGRLYWDGKPVEVQRRLQMSRKQAIGACFVALFVVVGSIGSAIQGAATLTEWACRSGLACNSAAAPAPMPKPSARPDIPA